MKTSFLEKWRQKLTPKTLGFTLLFSVYFFWQSYQARAVNDTWWHLRTGKALWEGTFTFEDQWSWTAHGAFWPAHELAFEWAFYGLWLLGGGTFWLVALVNSLLMVGTFALLYPPKAMVERFGGKHYWAQLAVFTLLGYAISRFVQLRAQAVSFFFFALVLHLILRKKTAWIPLTIFVWTWFHGSVLMGIGLMGIATVFSLISWLIGEFTLRKEPEQQPLLKAKRKEALRFSVSGILSLVATCFSPLGLKLWDYFFNQVFSFSDTNIAEWQPIKIDVWVMAIWALVLLLALGAVLILRREFLKDWRLGYLVAMVLVFGYYSWTSLRGAANLYLVAVPLLYLAFSRIPWVFKMNFPRLCTPKVIGSFMAIGVIASLALSTYSVRTLLPATIKDPFVDGGVREALLSERCYNFTWNEYSTGAYLIWYLPQVKVSVDSRLDLYPDWVLEADAVIPNPEGKNALDILSEVAQTLQLNCYLTDTEEDIENLKSWGMEVIASNPQMTLFAFTEDHRFPSPDTEKEWSNYPFGVEGAKEPKTS